MVTDAKTNRAFWLAKFASNVERDRKVTLELRRRGLRVLTLWECETTDPEQLRAKLMRFLSD